MKGLTDRTSYLRGLAEGLKIDTEKAENKLMLEMLAVMEDMAARIQELDSDVDELDEYVTSMESDLSDLEDFVYDDGDEDEIDDMEEFEADDEITVRCPRCGKEFTIMVGDINFDENVICPACGENILETEEENE